MLSFWWAFNVVAEKLGYNDSDKNSGKDYMQIYLK